MLKQFFFFLSRKYNKEFVFVQKMSFKKKFASSHEKIKLFLKRQIFFLYFKENTFLFKKLFKNKENSLYMEKSLMKMHLAHKILVNPMFNIF